VGLLEIAGLAFALGGDCLSVCIGLGMGRPRTARWLLLGALLGGAQAGLLAVGYGVAATLHELLHSNGLALRILGARLGGSDPAIVHDWMHRLLSVGGAALLLALGARMMFSRAAGTGARKRLTKGGLFLLAAAVNVDSLAAGIGLGMLDRIRLPGLLLVTALVGSSMAWAGLAAGRRIGRRAGRYAQPAGGAALLAVAAKVLLAELWR